MKEIQRYFESQERQLTEQFEEIRKRHSHPGVKGHANEEAVAEFLEENYTAKYAVRNVQIIDSYGESTGEVDVCICNEDQPFGTSPGQIVIAEGVDFVVQVKAVLTTKEIESVFENCDGVKKLQRKLDNGLSFWPSEEDKKYLADRIPYIVLAFSSNLKLETINDKFEKRSCGVKLERQPDAAFILGKGAIYNFREGKGRIFTMDGKTPRDYAALLTGEKTLLEFIRYINTFIPRIHRVARPLIHYLPTRQEYQLWARFK